ncbi:MAG: penicillin-binding protein activator LpoB [Candidatus Brocadiaceae bacterium]|nr:penicillin-binding protein activator LpoB [Candidatus Brocadiaceae bacterium]
MGKNSKYCLLLLPPLLFFGGCATHTQYVEPTGPRTIVTTDINIQDFSYAAEDMIKSLLASGALDKTQIQPAMLAISRIVNNTTQQIDTDLLIKKIRVALNQSGKALTTTTMGIGGIAEDPLAKGIQQEKEFYADKKEPQRMPNFTLSGKIIEKRDRQDDVRQVTYAFQLSLTDVNGLAVWEEEKQITKQGKRGVIGW